ncbi:nucleoporin protein Ndc1-Nup [Naematelia encephala]|uniref:Nucleoporin protein Ndc1-Nup n=1 Tax=Naematelia encephala TaxID=71784 RepID=A0A1Y2B990_9TREE|nr:nucleoporin protein Ndc1-Nup [Naematelia encephala]
MSLSALAPSAPPPRATTTTTATVIRPAQAAKPPISNLARIDAQYRVALTKRWYAFILRCAVFLSVPFALIIGLETRKWSIIPLSYLASILAFAIAVGPVLKTKRQIMIYPTKLTSKSNLPSILLSTLTSSSLLQLLGTHIFAAVVLTTTYAKVLTYGDSELDFGILSPTPRHPWHLNERFLFLLTGTSVLFIGVALREILFDRIKAVWPRRKTPLFLSAQRSIRAEIPAWTDIVFGPFAGVFNLINFTPIYTFIFTASHWALRRWWYRKLIIFSGGYLRPYVVNLAKSKSSVNVYAAWHLFLLEALGLIMLQLPSAAMNAYVTQPLNFDALTRKSPISPDRYLLTALKSQNPYHLRFTLFELLRVSNLPNRRQALFADIPRNPSSTSQSLICDLFENLLILLGRSHQTLVTRGGALSSSSSPAPTSRPAPDVHTAQIRSADIFRPVAKPKSILQNLLDGPIRSGPPPIPVQKAEIQVKQITGKAVERVEGVKKDVIGRIEGYPVVVKANGWLGAVYAWSGEEWARRNVVSAIPDVDQIRLIVDIFATLAVASIEEDTYGQVQHLLPSVLEAIVRVRSAALQLEASLSAQATLLGRAQDSAIGVVKVRVSVLNQACESGVQRIADKFGSSLGALRFPSSISAALTEICRDES